MTYTTNYQLPQWVKSDRIMMDDFNDANSKIDTALKSQADALNSLETNMASLGNCQLYYTTYTGTGTYGAKGMNSLTFPSPPLVLLVADSSGGRLLAMVRSAGGVPFLGGATSADGHIVYPVWDTGNTISWMAQTSAEVQANRSRYKYYYAALLSAE